MKEENPRLYARRMYIALKRYRAILDAERTNPALAKVLKDDLKGVGAGEMGHSTSQVGDLIVEFIEAAAA